MKTVRNPLLPVLAMASFLAFAACEQRPEEGEMTDEPGLLEEPGFPEEPGLAEERPIDVDLEPREASQVSGTARLTPNGDLYDVTLELDGAKAGESYPAHVHSGTCTEGGPIAIEIGQISVSEDGIAETTTSIDRTQLQPGQDYFVQVHKPDGTPIACADLPADELAPAGTEQGLGETGRTSEEYR